MYLYIDTTVSPAAVHQYAYTPVGKVVEGSPHRLEPVGFSSPIQLQCDDTIVQIEAWYPGVWPALLDDHYSKLPATEMMPVLAFAALTQTPVEPTTQLWDLVAQTVQVALVRTTDNRIGVLRYRNRSFFFESIDEPQYWGAKKVVTAAEVDAEFNFRIQVEQAKREKFANDPVGFLQHFNHFTRREARIVPMY